MGYSSINDGEREHIYTDALDSLKKLSGEFNDARNYTVPKTWHDFESMGYYDECEALQEVADALDDAELSCNFAINRLQWNVLGEVPEEYDTNRKHYDHDHVDHYTASAPRMASWPEEERRNWQAERARASAPDGQRRGLTEEEWRARRAARTDAARNEIQGKNAAIMKQLADLAGCAMEAARLGFSDAAYMVNAAAARIDEGTELLDEALAEFDGRAGADPDEAEEE